ncbi:hypothetical protein BDP27DRAFT_1449136 [Rhodocollybia butyracea]|uniref:Uncharacterized protein n=1 Tax=Rhodocollybia butyracea TaxID=206335 RepID=A0A9P5U502_9AGAR|nr:hypothetical protein BDP27DRAFT_1449136 [Rhodocollybia butyracea]
MHSDDQGSSTISDDNDGENKYIDMAAFLKSVDCFPIAKRALECLKLNQTLKFCPDPDRPWVMDPEDERLNSTSTIVSLAFEAAMSTYLYLRIMACERERYIQFGDIVFRISCEAETPQLEGVIGEVCKLLQSYNANGQSEFDEINDQANRLAERLKGLFKVELKDFPIDVLSLKKFNLLDPVRQ